MAGRLGGAPGNQVKLDIGWNAVGMSEGRGSAAAAQERVQRASLIDHAAFEADQDSLN